MNTLINDGTFNKGCLVRLKQYQQQEVKGKKYMCDHLTQKIDIDCF